MCWSKKKSIANIILIIATVIIIGLNIWWSVSIHNQYYNIWLNEYNAQVAQFGYYKEDIHLLDQYATSTALIWQVIGNIIVYISPIFAHLIRLIVIS